MRAYLEVMKKSFQNNLVYRFEYFSGIINTIVMIVVNIAIWTAIYDEDGSGGGVQFKLVITYVILGMLMQSVFTMEDYYIEQKVVSGLISSDLLKPISFRLNVFSYNIGALLFKLCMQMIPAVLIAIFCFGLVGPFNVKMGIFFLISAILGYLVLYCFNFIIWLTSFWTFWTFSIVTIKDALITVLSGSMIPLWFFPERIYDIIKLTPFDSIYYIPISIYLGQVPSNEIFENLLKQVIWIAVLGLIGHIVWKIATKKLVVQGG